MSVAIDANVLLYASDTDSPRHDRAVELVRRLATGRFPDITAKDPYRSDDDR